MPVTLDPAQLQKGGVAAASCMGSSVSGFRDFLLKGKVFLTSGISLAGCTAVCANVADRTGFASVQYCSRAPIATAPGRMRTRRRVASRLEKLFQRDIVSSSDC